MYGAADVLIGKFLSPGIDADHQTIQDASQYFVIFRNELFQFAEALGASAHPHVACAIVKCLETIVDGLQHAIHRLGHSPAGLHEIPILTHLRMLRQFLQRRTETFNDRRNLIEALSEVEHGQIGVTIVLQKLRNISNFQI